MILKNQINFVSICLCYVLRRSQLGQPGFGHRQENYINHSFKMRSMSQKARMPKPLHESVTGVCGRVFGGGFRGVFKEVWNGLEGF